MTAMRVWPVDEPLQRPERSARLLTTHDFLAVELLERWRRHCERAELPGADGEWSYTTNDGTAKIRSNENIVERRRRVEAAYKRGEFAYSKWEPQRASAFHQEVQRHMSSAATLAQLSAIVGEEIVRMSDVYVTIFQDGDFLSLHDDRGLGKYAFTLSLSSLAEGEGGRLRLYAAPEGGEGQPRMLGELRPRANELLIFSLSPTLLPHEVEPVTGTTRRSTIAGFLETRDFTCNQAFIDEAAGVDARAPSDAPHAGA
ncbi:2OG-Fe(II) oxygenase [Sorangium sp. So ce341]|uniref:2OG-Fe(II) oxygenase family protein n=1 Tax=Sorangium sp. So ce341 TaxID=3133302 RepID=UPI003F5EBCD1